MAMLFVCCLAGVWLGIAIANAVVDVVVAVALL